MLLAGSDNVLGAQGVDAMKFLPGTPDARYSNRVNHRLHTVTGNGDSCRIPHVSHD